MSPLMFFSLIVEADVTFNVKPRINPHIPNTDLYSPQRQLTFRCTGSYNRYSNMIFDIKYMIDGTEIPSNTANLSYSEILTRGALKASDWTVTGRTLGFKVKCLIRVKKRSPGSIPSLYQESDEFYAGLKLVNPQVTVFAGESAKIQIVSTVPVACYTRSNVINRCKLSFEMLDFIEVGSDACNRSTTTIPSACGLVMDGWRWNSPTSMYVTTLRNPKYQSDYTAIVKLRCTTGTIDSLWKNLEVPDVKVLIRNPVTKTYYAHCMSNEDPNIHTSDGSFYSHYGTGEFVLYAHKNKSINVHVIHQPLWGATTVNCAVAVQAASDVFIIYGCDQRNKWFIRRLNCDKSRGAYLEIFERNEGREYEIHLPTGTRVKVAVQSGGYLDIDVFPSTAELGNSHGLCGDFNGRSGDDYVDRNGKIISQESFKKHWSVNPIDSLFVLKSRNERLSRPFFYCTCVHDAIKDANFELNDRADCSWKESYSLCQPKSWGPKMCAFRHKRDTSLIDEGEDFDVHVDKVVYKDAPSDVLKWKNGWNDSTALEYCTKVLHESEAYKKCSAVEGLEDSLSVKGCINDIRVSGATDFAEQSIRAFKSSCINEVQLNTSLWRQDSKTAGTTLLDDIVENDCPNDCNVNMTKRGNCVNGFCQCFSGYAGDDCSVSTNKPPALTATFKENKCDVNKTVCMEVPVFGSNFHKSLSLQCRLQEKELNHTNPGHIDTVHLLTARMESFAEITCPLPDNLGNRKRRSTQPLSPKAFLVSITSNGNSFSNQIPVIIYDSACSDCQIIGTSMKCNPRNNICVIQDKCYSLSSTMCGNTDTANTSKSMLWIIGAALGGIALTAIVIVVLAKLMLRKGQKTGMSTPDLSQSAIYQAPKSTKYPY